VTSAVTELVVLTGFLGSGKTTLLLDILAQPEAADTALIINEVGEINIDGAIIADSGYSLPVALLTNGCVCCSISNDLLFTIEALFESRRGTDLPPFRRIVLECSGLSRPGPILRSLRDLARYDIRTRVIATMPCGEVASSAEFEETAAQLAAAHAIVITKNEASTPEERSQACSQARAINPLAKLIDTEDRRERALRSILLPEESTPVYAQDIESRGPGSLNHPRINIMRAIFPAGATWPEVEEWLENLVGTCGERLLRVKGIVSVADCPDPLLIQSVGTFFSGPRRMPRAALDSLGLVIIARDIEGGALRQAQLGCPASVSQLMFQTSTGQRPSLLESGPFRVLNGPV